MIDFIMKLEDMLSESKYYDWEIVYIPELSGYILKLDGHEIYMTDAGNNNKC